MGRKIANKEKTKKRRGNPAWGSKKEGTGKSGNPNGAPERGQSWTESVKKIGNMTGPEVAAWLKDFGIVKQFSKLPVGVTLKELVVVRVFVQLLNEPSPGLFSELMDRAEGTPKQTVEHSGAEGKPIKVKLIWGEESPIAEER